MSQSLGQSTALVTGAAGCIGSALTKRLTRAGWQVLALVRDPAQAQHLTRLPGVELIAGDINAPDAWRQALYGCDVVFHLAARVHAPAGTPADEFTRVNVEGTRQVFEHAVAQGVTKFVLFSTAAVYAESDAVLDENSPAHPVTPYGASKLAAENLVLQGGNSARIKTTVLRLPVVYGPRDRGNVAQLIAAIRQGRYVIVGDGGNQKSMIAVDNVADAALHVTESNRAAGQIYLVRDERMYTQREIAETIADLLGRGKRFPRVPYGVLALAGHSADVVSRLTGRKLPLSADRVRKLANNTRYSADKIARELGFKPRIGLREGLAQVISQL